MVGFLFLVNSRAFVSIRGLDRVALQERQRSLVEFFYLLIDRRMSAPFKDEQFRAANSAKQLVRKTSRCHHVMTAEGDLSWYFDSV